MAEVYVASLVHSDGTEQVFAGEFDRLIPFLSGFLRSPLPLGVAVTVACDRVLTGSSLSKGRNPGEGLAGKHRKRQ
jgi:hypothetical protein